MNILQVVSTLDPAYGGYVEVPRQISAALKDIGHKTELVTLDSAGASWVMEFPCMVHALGPARLRYGYAARLVPWLRQNLNRFDAVIVHGIWQYPSLAVWRAMRSARVPYFVFPHGALDPWFKRAYPFKHLKKWLYWPWAAYRILRDASAVLFTTEQERLLARQSFWLYQVNEVVVSIGIRVPVVDSDAQQKRFSRVFPFLAGKRLLLFMSRLDRKKGCDLLIGAFARVASEDPRLHLVMAGTNPNGWRATLEVRAKQLGIDDRVTWTGMLTGDLKWGAFHAAEALVLPSHSENFGVVVVEAVASKLPVLISNKVNIWREIAGGGAGLVGEDTLDGTVTLLKAWLGLSANDKMQMKERARMCYQEHFETGRMATRLVDVIRRHHSKEGLRDDALADASLRERVARERFSHSEKDVLGNSRRLKELFRHVVYSPTMRRLEGDFALAVGETNGKRVLDVGCGKGESSFKLLDTGALVTGIDVSEQYISEAIAEAARRGYEKYRYDFHVMDAHATSYERGRFDLIVGRGILHHLDLHKALKEFRRVLKPRGRAVFLEPLGNNPLLRLFRMLTPRMRTVDEKPVTANDLWMIETEWVSQFAFYGIASAPIAVITSIMLRPFPNNIFLRLADWAERRLNRIEILHAYNQYVLLSLTRTSDQ